MKNILLETGGKRTFVTRIESFAKFYSYVTRRILNDEIILSNEKLT